MSLLKNFTLFLYCNILKVFSTLCRMVWLMNTLTRDNFFHIDQAIIMNIK